MPTLTFKLGNVVANGATIGEASLEVTYNVDEMKVLIDAIPVVRSFIKELQNDLKEKDTSNG